MNKTLFAYHLAHSFGEFSLNSYHTDSENPTEGDLVYVISGDKVAGRRGVDYWLEGGISNSSQAGGFVPAAKPEWGKRGLQISTVNGASAGS